MKTLNGNIRVTRVIDGNKNDSYGCIEIEDNKGKRLIEINLSFSQFGEFILGRGFVDCEYILYKGKTKK
jgi:hypothetical protein